MVKRMISVTLATMVMMAMLAGVNILTAGGVWAQKYTIDDVMKEVQGVKQDVKQLQIGQAKIEGRLDGFEKRMDDFRGTLNFFGTMLAIITALVVGMFGFVVYIARNIKPAEEKEKKTARVIESIIEHIQAIEDKLQLPKLLKPIL